MKFLVIIFMIVLSSAGLCAQIAVAPAAGDGSVGNPYQIVSLGNLYWIAANNDVVPDPDRAARWSSHYVQTANIDASETEYWFAGDGWPSIGYYVYQASLPFTGSYNGQGHSITELFINRSDTTHLGLFGFIEDAALSNLNVLDATINGNSGGILVANAVNSTLSNCHTSGVISGIMSIGGLAGGCGLETIVDSCTSNSTVSGGGDIGGLIGYSSVSTISNSHHTGSVTGIEWIGGLIGFNSHSSYIANCSSAGTVDGMFGVGGLIGINMSSTVSDSYNTGDVTGSSEVGGLIGRQYYSTVSNSYNTGSVSGISYVGGLIANTGNSSIIINCYNTGSVNSVDPTLGGLLGDEIVTIVQNSFYNYEEALINGEQVISFAALNNTQFTDWLNNDLAIDIDNYLTSNGEFYLINDVADLHNMLPFGYTEEYRFLLTSNIDLSNDPGLYIPFLRGEFNGNGHTISNLYLDNELMDNLGFFGGTENAVISDLGIIDAFVTGHANTGTLAGYGRGSTFTGCFATGDVTGYQLSTGGLIGFIEENSLIVNCHFSGNATNEYLLGTCGGLVARSYNSSIFDSYSNGSIIGYNRIGGMVGVLHTSIVERCYSESNVNGGNWAGGLVGFNTSSSIIRDSYASGDVQGTKFVGGLLGDNQNGSVMTSYSIGSVSATDSYYGGLVGRNVSGSTVTDCYWNTETSGQRTSAGGEGRTTEEMTWPYASNTYVGWDFDTIWAIDVDYTINDGYPYLIEPPVSVEEEFLTLIEPTKLTNYPNPFNPETTILFSLPQDVGKLELKIYNIRGQLVRTLVTNTPHPRGEYQIIWDGKNDFGQPVTSGVYFYRMTTPSYERVNKMLLLK